MGLSLSVLSVDRCILTSRYTDGPRGADTRLFSSSEDSWASVPDGPQPPDLPSLHVQLSTAGDTGRGLVRDTSAHPWPSGAGQRCPPRTPSRGLGKVESHTCRKLEFFPPSLSLWSSGPRGKSGDRRELNSKCDPLWFQTQVLSPLLNLTGPV